MTEETRAAIEARAENYSYSHVLGNMTHEERLRARYGYIAGETYAAEEGGRKDDLILQMRLALQFFADLSHGAIKQKAEILIAKAKDNLK